MHRRIHAVVVVSLLSSAAWAEGGDIIVVEPDPKIAAEAANTEAEKALTPKNRGLLLRMVSYGCTRKARTMPDFIELSKAAGGKDVAPIYCQCITEGMIDNLTTETIKTIVKTRQPDPAFQEKLRPVAQACIKEATQ